MNKFGTTTYLGYERVLRPGDSVKVDNYTVSQRAGDSHLFEEYYDVSIKTVSWHREIAVIEVNGKEYDLFDIASMIAKLENQ